MDLKWCLPPVLDILLNANESSQCRASKCSTDPLRGRKSRNEKGLEEEEKLGLFFSG